MLDQVGEVLPTVITKELIFEEMTEINALMAKKFSDKSQILSLPSMTDERKLV